MSFPLNFRSSLKRICFVLQVIFENLSQVTYDCIDQDWRIALKRVILFTLKSNRKVKLNVSIKALYILFLTEKNLCVFVDLVESLRWAHSVVICKEFNFCQSSSFVVCFLATSSSIRPCEEKPESMHNMPRPDFRRHWSKNLYLS